ncbi:MAG TPA: metabolite traffic protein EboE [Polyangiaceae bacterium]|nr:metabolite traffic protein EboE [Polyangiaceae bacterium]
MKLRTPGSPDLSYCTNIHPGESLADVSRAVFEHVPSVKRKLGVTGPFGVGLRLSARAAEELAEPSAFEAFESGLRDAGLYVFTVNGFPHGNFHGERVKEAVYRPDWREPGRLAYSDRLAGILARLVPTGGRGSVSTVPGAFRARASEPGAAAEMADALVRHAATLVRLERETGRQIVLALEPEPECFLETTDDAVRFFGEHLQGKAARARLSALSGLSPAEAEAALRRHLTLCLDACHLAVEFEDATDALRKLSGAGIRIGKVQLTTALAVSLSGDLREDGPRLQALERFDDGVYLHQVVEKRAGRLARHVDLPGALAELRTRVASGPSELRVHFHVPVFLEALGPFRSTQPFLRDLLAALRTTDVSPHLEVETYTFGVLPEEHRLGDVDDAIARELSFTLNALGERKGGPS